MDRLLHARTGLAVRVLDASERGHDPRGESGLLEHLAQRGSLERLATADLSLREAVRARAGQAVGLLADQHFDPGRPASIENTSGGCLGELLHAGGFAAEEGADPLGSVPPAPRGGNDVDC